MTNRISIQKFVYLSLLTLVLLTAGCSSSKINVTRTGFLNNYSNLEENEKLKGLYDYSNDYVDMDQYSKLLIAPVQLFLDEDAENKSINAEEATQLADYFYDQLAEELGGRYEIVEDPAEDVMLIRTAITGVKPNKIYLNLHWSTTLLGAGIGGASLEAELVDSLNGEQIVALIDARKGKSYKYHKGLTKWGHTKSVLDLWARMLVESLDKLKDAEIN